jgi:hypothetical protein
MCHTDGTMSGAMAEAIVLEDRFDEKVMLKDITEQMTSDRECCYSVNVIAASPLYM